jgi:hypothetical protein
MPHHDGTMAIARATKVWLDIVADGDDHESLCACEVFAAIETRDGRVSVECSRWLESMATQRRYPMVRTAAHAVLAELSMLRSVA